MNDGWSLVPIGFTVHSHWVTSAWNRSRVPLLRCANVQRRCVITLPCDDHLTTLQNHSRHLKDVTRGTVVNKIGSNYKQESRLQLALGYCNTNTYYIIMPPKIQSTKVVRSDQTAMWQKLYFQLANKLKLNTHKKQHHSPQCVTSMAKSACTALWQYTGYIQGSSRYESIS